jgi:hypothetical protein
MSRLASFRGPSTPSPSPVQHKPQNSPASPSRLAESTYHRKTRTLLQELRSITQTWDDLVLIDGLKAAKSLVDTRTDLEYVFFSRCSMFCIGSHTYDLLVSSNALALIPDRRPHYRLIGPKLGLMEKRIAELDAVIEKLVRALFMCSPACSVLIPNDL